MLVLVQFIDNAIYRFINKRNTMRYSNCAYDTGSKVGYLHASSKGLFLLSFGSGKSLIALDE